jgi:hypothetical protein
MGILRGRNQPRVRMSAIWEVGRDMLAAGVGSSLLYRRGCSVKQLAGVCKQLQWRCVADWGRTIRLRVKPM